MSGPEGPGASLVRLDQAFERFSQYEDTHRQFREHISSLQVGVDQHDDILQCVSLPFISGEGEMSMAGQAGCTSAGWTGADVPLCVL